ncbi:MAG TPA: glutathione S-transferase family protein [Gammaproteobacteria bacterium]|nr:glutathione S-transferase family protein [Gammaproteobacteria bacterium]
MTDYRLTYFDIDGGRAEPIRIALHAAGIEYEDHRLSFPAFGETRQQFRFTCVPVLEIDGAQITQSNALTRYAGKLAGLYPDDPMQALYCDEAMGAVEDVTFHIGSTMRLQGEELRAARTRLVEGWLPIYLRGLGELLERRGGKYFADDRLTVADLKVSGLTGWLSHGALDHIPSDLVKRVAPGLVEHAGRIAQEPQVAAYYAARRRMAS